MRMMRRSRSSGNPTAVQAPWRAGPPPRRSTNVSLRQTARTCGTASESHATGACQQAGSSGRTLQRRPIVSCCGAKTWVMQRRPPPPPRLRKPDSVPQTSGQARPRRAKLQLKATWQTARAKGVRHFRTSIWADSRRLRCCSAETAARLKFEVPDPDFTASCAEPSRYRHPANGNRVTRLFIGIPGASDLSLGLRMHAALPGTCRPPSATSVPVVLRQRHYRPGQSPRLQGVLPSVPVVLLQRLQHRRFLGIVLVLVGLLQAVLARSCRALNSGRRGSRHARDASRPRNAAVGCPRAGTIGAGRTNVPGPRAGTALRLDGDRRSLGRSRLAFRRPSARPGSRTRLRRRGAGIGRGGLAGRGLGARTRRRRGRGGLTGCRFPGAGLPGGALVPEPGPARPERRGLGVVRRSRRGTRRTRCRAARSRRCRRARPGRSPACTRCPAVETVVERTVRAPGAAPTAAATASSAVERMAAPSW